jgi:hypothetical protein
MNIRYVVKHNSSLNKYQVYDKTYRAFSMKSFDTKEEAQKECNHRNIKYKL